MTGTNHVVVVGSGAAGLAAALAAVHGGARVSVLESRAAYGGTTALSGGVSWLPATRHSAVDGVLDTVDEARRYLSTIALGDVVPELADVFVTDAVRVADRLEEQTALRWHPLGYPDYHSERPGGRAGGRSLEPDPLVVPAEIAATIQAAPALRAPVTYAELASGIVDRAEVARRRRDGELTLGRAMVGALLSALVDAGVELRRGEPALALLGSPGHVTGVATAAGPLTGRVVLASGGFERDPELATAFLAGPMLAPTGAPGARGDGLRMAMAAGAALGTMSEAWWCPAISVPGETVDGAPLHRLILTERARPGSMVVDGRGARFVNEAVNYNDFGRTMHAFDAASFSYPRVPAWLLFDGGYRARYTVGPLRPGDPDPAWLHRADSLADLADQIGVPAEALQSSVERFNAGADAGRDADFGRGSGAYDMFIGDSRRDHPTLGALRSPPYFALRLLPGCLGTKGGPRTDENGRVRAAAGGVLEGLYAAGNAAASWLGLAYPGAGGTIGPALVFGTRAGEAAAGE